MCTQLLAQAHSASVLHIDHFQHNGWIRNSHQQQQHVGAKQDMPCYKQQQQPATV
jgi:hypothetical protein